jgi:hypothetical protein
MSYLLEVEIELFFNGALWEEEMRPDFLEEPLERLKL